MTHFTTTPDAFDDLADLLSGARRFAGNTIALLFIAARTGRTGIHQTRFEHRIEAKGGISRNPTSMIDGYVTPLQPQRGFRVVDGGAQKRSTRAIFRPYLVE